MTVETAYREHADAFRKFLYENNPRDAFHIAYMAGVADTQKKAWPTSVENRVQKEMEGLQGNVLQGAQLGENQTR